MNWILYRGVDQSNSHKNPSTTENLLTVSELYILPEYLEILVLALEAIQREEHLMEI